MKTFLRTILAIFAGLLVLFALVIAVELFSAVVHPFPENFGGTPEEMLQHVERYPPWVLAVAVPMWAFSAFAATWTAQRVGNDVSASVVGLLLLAALVCNLWMLPYPAWFKLACLVVIPLATIAGSRVAKRPAKV